LSGIAVSPIGLYALTVTPPDIARIAIATIAVILFFVLIIKRSPEPPQGKAALLLTGAAKALLGGFAAMPGPPVIGYFVRSSISAATARLFVCLHHKMLNICRKMTSAHHAMP
jgi:uncharacterized protein